MASSAKDVSPCVYGEAACPGNSSGAPSSGDDTFCAAGYTGALCGTCVRGYFFAWGEESCQVCQSAASHKATMRLWAVLCGACVAIAFAIACVVSLVDEFGTKENKAFLEAIVNTLNSDKALSRGVTCRINKDLSSLNTTVHGTVENTLDSDKASSRSDVSHKDLGFEQLCRTIETTLNSDRVSRVVTCRVQGSRLF